MIHFAIVICLARLTAAQDAPDTRDFLAHEFYLPYESGLWWPTKTYAKEVQFNPPAKQWIDFGVPESNMEYANWGYTHPSTDFIITQKEQAASLSLISIVDPHPKCIIFAYHGNGTIEINLQTGAVKLTNVTMDESGVLFWAGVIKAFPGVREIIKASP